MGKIRQLPPDLVNQIAAGEVVERPASVVKELCENSLDAGARSIRIELSQGGLSRIAVSDDGEGMDEGDARACLSRHATSKLPNAAALARIGSYGFRGEALPAIASVSRLTLTTRRTGVAEGTRVRVEGGEVKAVEACGAAPGTQVLVEELFFNTPARRKFLRRAETEASHCIEAAVRLALGRPKAALHLSSNDRPVLRLAPAGADPRERIAAALGAEVFPHLVPFEHGADGVSVSGFAASPDFSLPTARSLYTFVNGRYVRDRGLIAAVQRAHADLLPPGRRPAAIVYLALALEEVDVNVHPQKLEVRFARAARVYEVVYRALSLSLRGAPWLAQRAAAPPRAGEAPAAFGALPPSPSPALSLGLKPGPEEEPVLARHRAAGGSSPGFFRSLRVIGQLAGTYLVCEGPDGGLVVIDQHAAHERIKFEELRGRYLRREPLGQAFLSPPIVELAAAEAQALKAHLAEVQELGFEIEPFGGSSFAIKSIPAALVGAELGQLLVEMAHEFLQVDRGGVAFQEAIEEVLATMACHAAVRAHQALSAQECRALLDRLEEVDFKARCPHGRPVAAEISLVELERRVGRR